MRCNGKSGCQPMSDKKPFVDGEAMVPAKTMFLCRMWIEIGPSADNPLQRGDSAKAWLNIIYTLAISALVGPRADRVSSTMGASPRRFGTDARSAAPSALPVGPSSPRE